MKKIFTLAAAVLASFSLWADDATFTMGTIFDGNGQSAEITEPVAATVSTTTSKSNAKDGKLGSDGNYFQIVLTSETFSAASINGYINTTTIEGKNWGFQFSIDGGATWSEETLQANDGNKTAHDIAVEATIPDGANGFRVVRHAGTSTIVASITLTLAGAAAPVADPVASVTVAGPTEAFVGQKASFSATTDVKANAYKWFVNDAEQEGATSAKFDFTPNAEGNYSIVCQAKNDNNADFVASEAIVLVATVKPVLAPVSISEATVWDFSKAASVSEIKWEGDAKDADPIVMANIDGFNNNDNFNSQALLFSGEYPIRDGKFCQGPLLKFNTTVAGYLTIEYSNTGNRSAAEGETEGQEALRRFLAINGALVDGDEGSMKSNNNTITNNIPVAAGDVEISARMPYRTDEKDVNAPEYIRIYKVQFTLEEIPTGINNAEEAVKAVKVIRNGQLFIEKNGVLFNAQGARL